MVVISQIRLEGKERSSRLVRRSRDLHCQRSSFESLGLEVRDSARERVEDLLDETLDLFVEVTSFSDELNLSEFRPEGFLAFSKRLDSTVDVGDGLETSGDFFLEEPEGILDSRESGGVCVNEDDAMRIDASREGGEGDATHRSRGLGRPSELSG